MKYDWQEAERYFLNSGHESRISLREISERFQIPYQTVRRYAAKQEWHNTRYRAWIKKQDEKTYNEVYGSATNLYKT